jgi:hypothetical protein
MDITYDYSPEYWCGWIWPTTNGARTEFSKYQATHIDEGNIKLYPTLHEAPREVLWIQSIESFKGIIRDAVAGITISYGILRKSLQRTQG